MNSIIQAFAVALTLAAGIPAHAAEAPDAEPRASQRQAVAFDVGDSQCELRDDQVRCVRVQR